MVGRRDAEQVGAAHEAWDVMAFGQEVGRVLSDGRVVGRAEPWPQQRQIRSPSTVQGVPVHVDLHGEARYAHEVREATE